MNFISLIILNNSKKLPPPNLYAATPPLLFIGNALGTRLVSRALGDFLAEAAAEPVRPIRKAREWRSTEGPA